MTLIWNFKGFSTYRPCLDFGPFHYFSEDSQIVLTYKEENHLFKIFFLQIDYKFYFLAQFYDYFVS